MSEDARYDPTPGGMEWGTPQGTDYFKSLTPGEGKEREMPLKPLNIKARKPEDEKASVKVTEEMSSAAISKHEYPINNEKETFDTGDKGHWLTGKDGDWYIEQDVDFLDKEAENYTFDQAVKDGLYDEDELEVDDFDNTPGFDNEVEITGDKML